MDNADFRRKVRCRFESGWGRYLGLKDEVGILKAASFLLEKKIFCDILKSIRRKSALSIKQRARSFFGLALFALSSPRIYSPRFDRARHISTALEGVSS